MNNSEQSVREKLAAIEHERWADWQAWVHKIINEGVEGTTLEQFIERWERQINTPYADLSQAEKDSDLVQVDRYWPIVQHFVGQISAEREVATVTRFATEGYLTHWKSCKKGQHISPDCTCGLDTALAALHQAAGEQRS